MSFGPGAVNASAVHVGSTPATAVYLGSEKVWPNYVANQSPWYTPANGQSVEITWPAGSEFCDVIMIGGGAGGTGTGVAGNKQLGGGSGMWKGQTFPRIDMGFGGFPNGLPMVKMVVKNDTKAGYDGVGGGNFNTEAARGCQMIAKAYSASTGAGSLTATTTSADVKASNTGNRNGGNVAASFTFNGRTYTLDSYGVNAGRGGATSNKNGGSGNAPGGGGQSADDGGLTGYNGGNGATGAFILYWY